MFWFLRLFLAHLLADFPLQSNLIFRYKKQTKYGILLHTSIYLIISLLLSFPYLKYPEAIIFILFLFFVHTLIDLKKMNRSIRSNNDNIKNFIIDQLEHIISISLVFLLPISKNPEYLGTKILGGIINKYYNSDYYVLLFIGYFFVSFAGTIFYCYLIRVFGNKNIFTSNGVSQKEKYKEVLIRTIIFLVFYWLNFSYIHTLYVFIFLRSMELLITKNHKGVVSFFLITFFDFCFIFSMISFLNLLF
ncbi:MAG TPA: DUF3307 domain-containing protein [Dictyoglomaceae bacterium]|nr:DUF3307 domain-containing protein [Dictyoglomaceae bacterium]HOL39814.1 DUF3307 domain-containing protein [Dictyoglomaceae bacterium]HOP95305.1 DUF3307 domain-containing protein [Dictyoglomaceae bacterium]HPP16229.1 DUF3307 domain-containing protein [Dictyoglomaceae bacterium]HPU42955.1 DUF3307 domain-containing protein [Dictyoglomaceae bacterium]